MQKSIQNTNDIENCSTCAKNNPKKEETTAEEELKLMRTALVQMQILKSLKLRHAPNFTEPISQALRDLMKSIHFDENQKQENNENQNTKPKTIVVFPDEILDRTFSKYPAVTLYFNFTPKTLPKEVASAELWFHKTKSEESIQFEVTEIIGSSQPTIDYIWGKHDVENISDASKPQWVVSKTLTYLPEWFNNPNDTHRIEISCPTCMDGTKPPISISKKRKPFLVFKINDTKSDRNKRSTSCSGSNLNGCCKQPLFISFSEIGWDDWIIQPSGYMANYCRGSCLNEIDRSRYYYSTVVREYITKQKDKAEKLNLTLCCTPSKMSSISLIYREQDNVILRKNLPDMVVEECDCA